MRFIRIAFIFIFLFQSLADLKPVKARTAPAIPAKEETASLLYDEMNLGGIVNFAAFRQAVIGYTHITQRKRDVLTLIDFSRPSTECRLFVFDMKEKKLLLSSVVAHGRNSGENYATSFSNEEGSYKSSLGFYLTDVTYNGKHGYSLVLDGLEEGINDHARQRAIVVHGASYADPSFISRGGGRLGRSLGCPAVPDKFSRPLIDAIKGGSVLYIYAAVPDYMAQSKILNIDEKMNYGINVKISLSHPSVNR